MSDPTNPAQGGLDDRGCCEGLARETPATIDNRPGLSDIAYRAGTHATFKRTMLARLSASEWKPPPTGPRPPAPGRRC